MKRALAGLLLLSFACCGDGADVTPPPGITFAEALEVEGMPNLARIHDGLYRGGQPDDKGFQWLKDKGFKTIINLRSYHDETEEVGKLGMKAVRFPVQADLFGSEPPEKDQIESFFKIILDPAQQPVYFHCAHGKDRTGTMAALYRMEVDGWTNDEAIAEMQRFGYHDIYKDLINFVRAYKPRGYAKPEK